MSGASGTPKAASNSTLRVTLLLALLLLLIGAAGAGAMALLQHAIRPPTSDDIAQLVCTTYTTQNYDPLLAAIDPTPVPPATGPFDATAQSTLRKTLQSLDSGSGVVTSCSYSGPVFADPNNDKSQRRYIFTMQRAHHNGPLTMQMFFTVQPDGGWKISRGSDFSGAG